MVECRCVDDDGNALSLARWFDPNNVRVATQQNAPKGGPYRISGNNNRLATLVIPTFSDSYDGTYTCGIGNNHPPTPMITIGLSLAGNYVVIASY